ncbi:uncharacterized protein C20orf85 homolog [Photinus pyralis]|uniref:uncharacterized protein C20orf85 homolog n=1 Tax=Photinus pyralis TaxID=7054 RepID=UPI001267825C|nr:uncharacterized protein C20orf85 homolog [Photinus pyralis]
MAFGKPPDVKALKVTPTVEDQLWKANVRCEEVASEAWKTKWGWILTEYGKLHEKMTEASKNSVTLRVIAKKLVENRSTKPVPVTESNKIGWLASRSEFKLEKYGPDVYKGMPFISLSGV